MEIEHDDIPTCLTCRWWDNFESRGITAECRRFPPGGGHWRPDDHQMNFVRANWPETMNSDWCGEHSAALVDLTK